MINWNVCKCLFVNFYFKFFGEKWENVMFYEVDFFFKKKFVMKGEFNDMISFFRVVGY